MLFPVEKILFTLAVIATLYAAGRAIERLVRIIGRGHGKVDWSVVPRRLIEVIARMVTLQPTWRVRLGPSLFHAFVAWGFMYYLLVNLGDVLQGFIPGFHFLGTGIIGNLYHLGADLLSAVVLVGMVALIIRRWALKPAALTTRKDVLLHPSARSGILRDSAIVAGFILVHVGSRFLGASVRIAESNRDAWQPFGNAVAGLWLNLSPTALLVVDHLFFWLALGTILAFIPYFPYSKHIHLFFAPLNYLLKPGRRSIGELSRLDFEDETIEQFGATHLEDLGWEQLMDSYACIMCYRCQEVCPAYNTGKVLSPAAMEINKRYLLNVEGSRIARGETSSQTLVEFAIPEQAIWACTACGACIDICPVNNEPMRDILDIRRSLVLMDNQFPRQLQAAFRGMECMVNPWNVSPAERMKWAEGLDVPTIEVNPTPEILWWVGCAPATDPRAQKTARAFAQVLKAAGVNYAVLGEKEQCNGDSARRAGKEDLFEGLATANVEMINQVAPKRIVTTCPHCLHTLKNEYPAFGGNYHVLHHTQFINELLLNKRLVLKEPGDQVIRDQDVKEQPGIPQPLSPDPLALITYHDPCYLGRHNGIINEPRQALQHSVLRQTRARFVELRRHGRKSFCCGAGGAQMWKEEEHGSERVSANRMREAIATGAEALAVACPFCMIMLSDARKAANAELQVLDVAEIVLQALDIKGN